MKKVLNIQYIIDNLLSDGTFYILINGQTHKIDAIALLNKRFIDIIELIRNGALFSTHGDF